MDERGEGGMSMYVTVKQFPTTRQPKFDHFEPTKKKTKEGLLLLSIMLGFQN